MQTSDLLLFWQMIIFFCNQSAYDYLKFALVTLFCLWDHLCLLQITCNFLQKRIIEYKMSVHEVEVFAIWLILFRIIEMRHCGLNPFLRRKRVTVNSANSDLNRPFEGWMDVDKHSVIRYRFLKRFMIQTWICHTIVYVCHFNIQLSYILYSNIDEINCFYGEKSNADSSTENERNTLVYACVELTLKNRKLYFDEVLSILK